jgi:hypothetical protein
MKMHSRKRNSRRHSHLNSHLSGGWKSVPKSNPKLWSRVLQEVKREPGPWAAWKAIKADKLYKQRGGRFL